jgi:hypothetical protein
MIEGSPPSSSIQKIWCDFNAFGLSDEENDNCYYSLHREEFAALPPQEGLEIFIWDDSDETEVIGYVAKLEKTDKFHTGWRARPDEQTRYRGPKLW